jgi:hypothetical protein
LHDAIQRVAQQVAGQQLLHHNTQSQTSFVMQQFLQDSQTPDDSKTSLPPFPTIAGSVAQVCVCVCVCVCARACVRWGGGCRQETYLD